MAAGREFTEYYTAETQVVKRQRDLTNIGPPLSSCLFILREKYCNFQGLLARIKYIY